MNKQIKAIRKAQKKVRRATIEELDMKTEEVIAALKDEKWRWRALTALWLIMPSFKKRG